MSDETFCRDLPVQPSIWDPTRIATAMTCWRKHYLGTVRGLRQNRTAGGNVNLEAGSLYHGMVEQFDLAILAGVPRDEAIRDTIRQFLATTWVDGKPWGGTIQEGWQCTDPAQVTQKRNPDKLTVNRNRCEWAKMPRAEMPLRRASDALCLEHGYDALCDACGLPAFQVRRYAPDEGYEYKNRLSLLHAFLLYADDQSGLEPYAFPDGTPAVELQARVPLGILRPDGEPYELLANMDSMVLWDGELSIRERKTTRRSIRYQSYWDQFNPNVQIDTYELVGFLLYADEHNQPPRVLIEAVEFGKGYVRLRRMPFRMSAERRDEWLTEVQFLILEAERRAQEVHLEGVEPDVAFPRNPTACIQPWGACPFLDICRAPASTREGIIRENYHVERWNPLKAESEVEE